MLQLGKTQRAIVGVLIAECGATNTYTLQKEVAVCASGFTAVSRSAHRLCQRGLLKCVTYAEPGSSVAAWSLTLSEVRRLAQAQIKHPRASTFWVMRDVLAEAVVGGV